MTREEKIKFIVDNFPEFDRDTPDEWREWLRDDLQKKNDEELQDQFEFVDYLLDK